MEEVRQLVQEEGREARNLVAFHVAVDTPNRVSRKPPRVTGAPPPRRATPRPATRLRSASAGRDKRSELRARYWALLFGDLQRACKPPGMMDPPRSAPPPGAARQRSASAGRDKRSELQARLWSRVRSDLHRAVGEIYNTVEIHENINECHEVILVLENYTRDFKALAEWFRLKWEYDNTPPPQRPQSLAWEIRKTDFVRPESRKGYSVKSSPSVSGKNSPLLSGHNTPSGKNSPNLTGKASPASGKISPRVSGHSNTTSPKANIEFFSSKICSKITAKPEPKSAKEISRLSDIKEKDIKDTAEENDTNNASITTLNNEENNIQKSLEEKDDSSAKLPVVEIGKAKECPNTCPKMVVIKSPKRTVVKQDDCKIELKHDISSAAKATINKLDAMENEFLAKQLTENVAKNENLINLDKESAAKDLNGTRKTVCESNQDGAKNICNDEISSESREKSDDNFADVSNESSSKSIDEKAATPNEKTLDVTKNLEATRLPNGYHEEFPIDAIAQVNGDECLVNGLGDGCVLGKEQETKESPPSAVKETKKDSDIKKIDSKATTEKPNARPAYSQAAAKPKPVTSTKSEVKTPTRFIARSKTVVEMRPNSVPKAQRQFPKRNQTNQSKCSYPFNLTTGRTSLFDTQPNKSLSKKPVNRIQMGSGDNKIAPKIDLKKRPPRPTSLKINEKGDKKEKINPSFDKKDGEEYSSTDTIVTQIDMSRIESSESLKTLVPEEADVANSVEVLNVDNTKTDNDGWLTVKSRRLSRESKKQSKSHWANRFHQPSATTSLPTLNMIESPKQEVKEIVSSTKLDRAKSEQPQNKPEKPKVSKPKPEMKDSNKESAMIRQKSDVTGLKTRTSRTKALRREKVKEPKDEGSDLTKNRLHSSLESLTTGLARSQEKTQETFDFDKWKSEFMTTFKFLEDDDQMNDHNEILKSADPSEMSEIAEMTSQIEENERKISWALDFQSEVDQRKLCEEEDLLNRQIMELQQVSDIDLDTETDDTETDAEILCEDTSAGASCQSTENLSLAASLEDQYETALAGMSWAERVDTLGALEALVARDPGRAQQLHAKLSQGIKRRGSLQDALRRLQLKQARAERQRIEYQTERARKIHQLLARVEEVKVAKNQLIEEKRLRMERRLQKAAENRDQHLKDIVRKAHDEEEKLREIAFIKQLEAENRRHEFLDQCRSHTTRLRQMRRDRLSKLEQKAAREAAVGARRQALEAARKLHVETLLEKRKERDARVEELKEQKKQERDDAAREKAEGVKSRLSALAAAAELEADALRSRIRDKQDASQQRLESHLQAIREKATGPRQATTSESQEQTSKEEESEEEADRLEQERREKEKQKSVKKKARKVRQKLLSTCNDTIILDDTTVLEITTPDTSKINKVIHQLQVSMEPLIECKNHHQHNNDPGKIKLDVNGFDDDGDKKKNKKNKNKMVNGHGDKNERAETNNNIKEMQKNYDFESVATGGGKKKKKKGGNNNFNDRLTKTSSVCSSLSDMSRSSNRVEKFKSSIDMTVMERQLNELNRLIERLNLGPVQPRGKITGAGKWFSYGLGLQLRTATPTERASFHKIHVLNVMSQLLNIATDRDDDHSVPLYSARALNTAVTIVSRIISSCSTCAAYFLSADLCVHVVKLLSMQLDKDLQSDTKEMELTKQLCDCISVAMDSVLCATQAYVEANDWCSEDKELLTNIRSRTHTLISYFCLCGCVSKAEDAGQARESIQTLLTVCADMCHATSADVVPERLAATQSLRCALGTGLLGSRAEFCMLFDQGAELDESGGFVRAARTAHLLRALAELDHTIVQEAFGEGRWPLEFRAAVSRLLSQHAPNDKEAPRTACLREDNQRLDQSLSETMVMDLIVLVGFVIVDNPQLQETICDGWGVIKTLCTLPANWLVSKTHSHALIPTLIALTDLPSAADAILAELSVKMLNEYLKSEEADCVKLVQVMKQARLRKLKEGKI